MEIRWPTASIYVLLRAHNIYTTDAPSITLSDIIIWATVCVTHRVPLAYVGIKPEATLFNNPVEKAFASLQLCIAHCCIALSENRT
jgi:hypothetical protein